jgi:hypothetical protein
MRFTGVAAAAVALGLVLLTPSVAHAAPPADRGDPCSRAGRDTCGTTGVGFYRVYRYGIRWFGDYRGAVRGERNAFCLDLRFWYASPRYRYRRASVSGLRNRDGEAVPLELQRRLAYAIWRYGRSDDPVRQAAVMLYVHSLMGDGRPGEVDPAALGARVATLYERIARASSRLHGPYRIEARLPARRVVGEAAPVVLRVVAASGHPLPGVRLALSATGATGVPARVRTDGSGSARFVLTPTALAGVRLRVRAEGLASPRPHVFAATTPAARPNAQRLAVPAAKTVASTIALSGVTASPRISTQVSAQSTVPGASITDAVVLTGLGGASVPVKVELWGPFASRGEIACTGTPYWQGSFVAHGDGTTTTQPVRLEQAGFYTYRESIVQTAQVVGVETPCGASAETTFARAGPLLTSVPSAEVVRPGARIADHIHVGGLGKTPATIQVELYGPFPSRASIRCGRAWLHWRGNVRVEGNGGARSVPVKVARAGFYAFRERIAASSLVAGTASPCGHASSISLAVPQIVTGRGDVSAEAPARASAAARPVRISVDSLAIQAAVAPVAIDLAHGVLGIPTDVARTGWWRDGALPGARHGTILIAGHVDSATAGAGAFFRLGRVHTGDRVELETAGGRRLAYRVASVRSYRKHALPTGVFSRTGPPRLVLVTCGGPFDEATGHYRDDVVVAATPVR